MEELAMPPKLIRLLDIPLKATGNSVRVKHETAENSGLEVSLRHADLLSTWLFNNVLEQIIDVHVNRNGHQVIGYCTKASR